jgi:Protein of unknown function (DUF2628).
MNQNTETRLWHVANGSQQSGPYSEDKLPELVAQGIINHESMVWHEGLPSWQKAVDTDGLLPPTNKPAAPFVEKPNAASAGQKQDASSSQMYSAFVQKNTQYYLPIFELFKTGVTKTKWNWCAFLFSVSWLVYRKAYAPAAVLYLLNLASGLIPYIGTVIQIVLWIGIGLYGNFIYWKKIETEIAEMKRQSPESQQMYAQQKGGTNVVACCVVIVIGVIIGIIIGVITVRARGIY